MKKPILFFAILIFSFAATGQTKKEVKQALTDYSQEMIQGNWAKSLDFTYPGLFTVIPKEQMEQMIVETFSDTSVFVIGFNNMKYGSSTSIYKEETYSYSFVNYSLQMTLKFVQGTPEENFQLTLDLMKSQYGDENVRLEGRTLIIDQDNNMAAIKNSDEDKIYFLEIKSDLIPVFEQFMSPKFVENASTYIAD